MLRRKSEVPLPLLPRSKATGRATALMQRFVFNINWSPEDFRELTLAQSADADAGALELF